MADTKTTQERVAHESIVKGNEIKPSKAGGFLSNLLKRDANAISNSIMNDIVTPRADSFIKEMDRKVREFCLDAIDSIARRVIFQDNTPYTPNSKSGYGYSSSGINYVKYYTDSSGGYARPQEQPYERPMPVASSLVKIAIPSYGKAEEVVTELIGLAKRYPQVHVGDYYTIVEYPTNQTNWDYGWKGDTLVRWYNSTPNYIIDVPGGYMITLPPPVALT